MSKEQEPKQKFYRGATVHVWETPFEEAVSGTVIEVYDVRVIHDEHSHFEYAISTERVPVDKDHAFHSKHYNEDRVYSSLRECLKGEYKRAEHEFEIAERQIMFYGDRMDRILGRLCELNMHEELFEKPKQGNVVKK